MKNALRNHYLGMALFLVALFLVAAGEIPLFVSWLPKISLGLMNVIGAVLLPSIMIGYIVSYVFSQQLTEDAFKASVGYILSPELRSELQWIYEQCVVCHYSICDFYFEVIDEKTVVSVMEAYRTFRNEGASTTEFTPSLTIDEWKHPAGTSKIEYLRYSFRGEEVAVTEKNGNCEMKPYSISLEVKKPLKLKPREEITVKFKSREFKQLHDDAVLSFSMVTLRPLMKLHYDKTKLSVRASVSHRLQSEEILDDYLLEGVLLPGQHIRIWWLPNVAGGPGNLE